MTKSVTSGLWHVTGDRLARAIFVLLLVALGTTSLLTSHSAFAQSTNASISGQITDPQGRAVPAVEVTAINTATNVTYPTKSNTSGIYSLPNLPPGEYRLDVKKDGFREINKLGYVLHVQDNLEQNFALELGSVGQSVTVTADQTNINTTDATVSTTIDRNFAENLPLNGRSFQTLILLTPGTVLAMPPQNGSSNGGTISINGQRSNANSFTVDGVSADLGGFVGPQAGGQVNGANPSFTQAGTTQGMVSVDGLQEFKIQTSTYAPEFGRQPGGQVSLLTRSGTNSMHGTAFEYLRNEVFDANNWFNDHANPSIPKGKERQNDFGGTIGGPIFKNRTFFFFSYEGLRLLQPFTQKFQVPPLAVRQAAAPVFQPVLNSWPLPDPGGSGITYTFSESQPTDIDSFSIKLDQTLGKRTHVFGRYSDTPSSFGIFPTSNSAESFKLKSRAVTLGADISVSPNVENEVRANYSVNVSRTFISLFQAGGAKSFDTSIFAPAPLVNGRDFEGIFFNIPNDGLNFQVLDLGSQGKISQRQINLIDNVSYSFGTHQLKWGVDYRRLFPIFGFQPLRALYQVSSHNDLTAGNVSFAQESAFLVAHPIYQNLSLYAQDTWRESGRLSLTYGLRWELNPPPGERNGIQPANLVGLNDPATATLAPPGTTLYKTTYNNFAPRVGLAYQVRQSPGRETVVRAGFGVFYDLNSETTALGFGNSDPFQANSLPFASLAFPLANNVFPPLHVPVPLAPPFTSVQQIFGVNPNLKLPYTLQWNVSIEQAFGQNQSVTASYVASTGYSLLRTDLLALAGINPNFPNLGPVGVVRNSSSSNYQSLQVQFNRTLSHGLQALASYTYSHCIDNASDGQADLFSTSLSGTGFLNPNIDRGNCDFDLRHAFRGGFTYNTPTWSANSFSRALLSGWSIDAIGIGQSGLPVNLIGGSYFLPSNFLFLRLRPDIVSGIPLYLFGAQCTAANSGIACPGGRAINFTPGAVAGGCPGGLQSTGPFCPVPTDASGNPTQVQGTLGRNVLRDFGNWQIDFAIHRQFNFTERVNLQFRAELFNVFNHPNFSNIDNNVGDGPGAFGLSQSTLNSALGGLNRLYQIGGPRSIQLALKLSF